MAPRKLQLFAPPSHTEAAVSAAPDGSSVRSTVIDTGASGTTERFVELSCSVIRSRSPLSFCGSCRTATGAVSDCKLIWDRPVDESTAAAVTPPVLSDPDTSAPCLRILSSLELVAIISSVSRESRLVFVSAESGFPLFGVALAAMVCVILQPVWRPGFHDEPASTSPYLSASDLGA